MSDTSVSLGREKKAITSGEEVWDLEGKVGRNVGESRERGN